MLSYKYIITLFVSSIFLLTNCTNHTENISALSNNTGSISTIDNITNRDMKNVKAILAKDLHTIEIIAKYPAKVVPLKNVKISARSNGIITDLYVKVGDSVRENDIIAIIDKDKENNVKKSYEQAVNNYIIAKTNYEKLKDTVYKDLKQLDILKSQNINSKDNIDVIADENYKSAKIAYDTSVAAYEQAKINLENKKKQLDQNEKDIIENTKIVLNIVYDTCGTVLNGLNSITGFNPNNTANYNYISYFGGLKSDTKYDAKSSYLKALYSYNNYKSNDITSINHAKISLENIQNVLIDTKSAAEKIKIMIDFTPPSTELPYNSNAGNSISSFLSTVNNYINQINNVYTQLNNIYQSVNNFTISKISQLDTLQKAYEITQKQKEQAMQNLNNISANTKSQKDNIKYSIASIENQYDATYTKFQSQLDIAYLQMESARIQMENAKITYDNLFIKSTIDGVVDDVFISIGDNVSTNTNIVSVSDNNISKVKFYIDNDYIKYITKNAPISIHLDERIFTGNIISISNVADTITHKFLVESILYKNIKTGNIAYVKVPIKIYSDNFLVKLSAIEVGQGGNYIFIIQDGRVKKRQVDIINVLGEYADIKGNIKQNEYVVVDGNKYLVEDDLVKFN